VVGALKQRTVFNIMEHSAIEWTDNTWNPWVGCLKVSPGCKQCYMYRDQERYGRDPKVVKRTAPATFSAPLKWREPAKVFTCSWSDFFIEQADAWRGEAWDIIRRTPHLTYQILTKRAADIHDCLPEDWGDGWPNVWLGVSVESEAYLWRVEALSEIPAIVRFISYEPALGPVDFTAYAPVIHWIISGGESGYNPRPANPEWFLSVRDQCAENGIAYFHKQNGGNRKINGTWGGKELAGSIYHELPLRAPTLRADDGGYRSAVEEESLVQASFVGEGVSDTRPRA
jgi:protein gp37